MLELTPRRRNVITGLIAVVIVMSLVTIGIKFSFGAYDAGYELEGSFSAAGQGLVPNSDVKIRGVNVGHVRKIELRDGRAYVTMFIDGGQQVPFSAIATIRPKTLFGEKFVDISPGKLESSTRASDFYADGDVIDRCDKHQNPDGCTVGGFELERVLSDAYPLLKAIDPDELANVLSTLAEAGNGLGPEINRSIVNSDQVFSVMAAHDLDTREFLADLAALSNELAGRAGDVVAGAANLNQALPALNARGAQLNDLLVQASRLSSDLADVLDNNREFLEKNVVEGGKTIQLLYDHRTDVVPLVIGLRQYIQTLVQVGHFQLQDGTIMAAVKGILGGDVCAEIVICPPLTAPAALGAAAPAGPVDAAALGLPGNLPKPDDVAAAAHDLTTIVLGLVKP